MTDYSQLPDAELERKVLDLMGYEVVSSWSFIGNLPTYWLTKDGKKIGVAEISQSEAWSHAPSPLTDANVTMGLVDEIMNAVIQGRKYWRTRSGFILKWNQQVNKWYCEAPRENGIFVFAQSTNRARAICEVYCMVKEGEMSKQVDDILDGLRQPLFRVDQDVVKLQERIASLERDHKLMRETLEKYADNGSWILPVGEMGHYEWRSHTNGFYLAWNALQKLEVKDG